MPQLGCLFQERCSSGRGSGGGGRGVGYEVRKRHWPFLPRLKRPWELIRRSDMKPVGFYVTQEEGEAVKADIEERQSNG